MSGFKEGDRVIVQNWSDEYDGLGTVVRWEGNIEDDIEPNHYYVQLDNCTIYDIKKYPNDNHSVPEKYIRKATKLDKALK